MRPAAKSPRGPEPQPNDHSHGSCPIDLDFVRFRPHPGPGAEAESAVATPRTLYEPSTEHDSCGFGFVADITGRASHAIVRDALTVLVNLEHRGASGSEKNTGDGAGLLVKLPYRFLGAVAAEGGLDLPAGGLRRGDGVPAARRREPRGVSRADRPGRSRRRARAPRLARRAHDPRRPRRLRPLEPAGHRAGVHRPARRPRPHPGRRRPRFERRLYVIRRLVEKAVAGARSPGGASSTSRR